MKIKLSLFLIFIIPTLTLLAQETKIIVPGKSYGSIELKVSTMQDVEAIYGTKYKKEKKVWTEHFVGKGFLEVTKTRMTYKKSGLMFYFSQREDEKKENLIDIQIQSPQLAKTDKGIEIDSSTFQDVKNVYGNVTWTYSNRNLRVSKIYPGITYSTFIKKEIKRYDKAEFNELYLNAPINQITITAE